MRLIFVSLVQVSRTSSNRTKNPHPNLQEGCVRGDQCLVIFVLGTNNTTLVQCCIFQLVMTGATGLEFGSKANQD